MGMLYIDECHRYFFDSWNDCVFVADRGSDYGDFHSDHRTGQWSVVECATGSPCSSFVTLCIGGFRLHLSMCTPTLCDLTRFGQIRHAIKVVNGR